MLLRRCHEDQTRLSAVAYIPGINLPPPACPPCSFLRVSKRMVEKMGQNAAYMGLTVRRSWQQLLRELNSDNKDH